MQDNSLRMLVDPANPNFEDKNGNTLRVHYVSLGYTLACGIPTTTQEKDYDKNVETVKRWSIKCYKASTISSGFFSLLWKPCSFCSLQHNKSKASAVLCQSVWNSNNNISSHPLPPLIWLSPSFHQISWQREAEAAKAFLKVWIWKVTPNGEFAVCLLQWAAKYVKDVKQIKPLW